jgi:hypothetical protein
MNTIPIDRYTTLRKMLLSFAGSDDPLLLVKGQPGLGKTETIQRVLRKMPHLLVRGKKSPLDLYIDLYEHRDMLVVIDDVDALLGHKDGQEIIRDVTETVNTKTIRWGTQSPILEEKGIPKRFQTSSRVILLTNEWRQGGVRDAIASRALAIEFLPTWSELCRYAAKWFDDQVVLDYVNENLPLLEKPDLRILIHARQLRKYGVPGVGWQAAFNECWTVSKKRRAVSELLADESFSSNNQRAAEFVRLGHGDRATFYRHLGRFKGTPKRSVERVVAQSKSAATPAEGASSGMAPPKRRPGRPRKTPPVQDVVVRTPPGIEQAAAHFQTSVKEVTKCF